MVVCQGHQELRCRYWSEGVRHMVRTLWRGSIAAVDIWWLSRMRQPAGPIWKQVHFGSPEPKVLFWLETRRLIADLLCWTIRFRVIFDCFAKYVTFSRYMNKIGKNYLTGCRWKCIAYAWLYSVLSLVQCVGWCYTWVEHSICVPHRRTTDRMSGYTFVSGSPLNNVTLFWHVVWDQMSPMTAVWDEVRWASIRSGKFKSSRKNAINHDARLKIGHLHDWREIFGRVLALQGT
jgi:hypothetical protein